MITGYLCTGSGRQLLFSEGMKGAEVTRCSVKKAMDEVDSAKIELPVSNKAARAMLQKNAVIEIEEDGVTEFVGDVATVTQTEQLIIALELDGALGWLRNICKPPFQIYSGLSNAPVANFLGAIFTQYNAAIDGIERIMHLGTVTVTGDVVQDHHDEYTRMLDIFQEIRDQLGGHFYTDYSDGIPKVHYVGAPSVAAVQVLELGLNVLTVENQLDFTDYASRIYAAGTDENDQTITTFAMSALAEATFGRCDAPLRAEGKTISEIYDEAQAELERRKSPLASLSITAAELDDLGVGFKALSVGTAVRALCVPLGINEQMMVRSVTRDFIHRENSSVTLGKAPRTLTGMM